jgi:hypothetical protein
LFGPFADRDGSGLDVVLRAQALAGLAACWIFVGQVERAGPVLEEALATLEAMRAWRALTSALITRAVYLVYGRRRQEGVGVLRHALALAEEHDLPFEALRAHYNLAATLIEEHEFAAALEEIDRGIALARERGDHSWDERMRQQSLFPMAILGRWREALPAGLTLIDAYEAAGRAAAAAVLAQIAEARDDGALMARCRSLADQLVESNHADMRASNRVTLAREELWRGSYEASLRRARPVLDTPAIAGELRADAYAICVEAALALADGAAIEELQAWCGALPPAHAPALLLAGRERLLAEQAHSASELESAIGFEQAAIDRLRGVGAPPLLARALLDRWRRRADAQALAEARAICIELGATRWLEALPDPERTALQSA